MQAPSDLMRRLIAENPPRYPDILRDIVPPQTAAVQVAPHDFSAPLREDAFLPLSSLTNERVEYPDFSDVFTDSSFLGTGGSATVYKAKIAPNPAVNIPATILREKFYAVKTQHTSVNEARMNLWIAQIPEALIPNIVRPLFWLRLRSYADRSVVLFVTIMEYIEGGSAGSNISKFLIGVAASRDFAGLRRYIASGTAQVLAGLCELSAAGIKNFRHNDMHTDNVLCKRTEERNAYFVYRYSAAMCLVVPTDGVIWVVADFGRSSGQIATQSVRPETLLMASDDSMFYLKHVQRKIIKFTEQYPYAETSTLLDVMHNATKTAVESIDVLRTATLFDDFRCPFTDADIKKLIGTAKQVYVDIRPAEQSLIKHVADCINTRK